MLKYCYILLMCSAAKIRAILPTVASPLRKAYLRVEFPSPLRAADTSEVMAVVLDLLNKDSRPRHPEKAHRPRPTDPAQARLDSREGARFAEMGGDQPDREGEQARHRLRGGRLPEYRRVLGKEARHLHDHGRHLYPRLCFLQRQDRAAGSSGSARAGECRQGCGKARAAARRDHFRRSR